MHRDGTIWTARTGMLGAGWHDGNNIELPEDPNGMLGPKATTDRNRLTDRALRVGLFSGENKGSKPQTIVTD
jgi:hypothetical protein